MSNFPQKPIFFFILRSSQEIRLIPHPLLAVHVTPWWRRQADVAARQESTGLAEQGTGQWPGKRGRGLSVSCSSSQSKRWPLKHDQEWESGNDLWLKDNQKGGKWRESANEKRLVEPGERGIVRVRIWKETSIRFGFANACDSWKCDLGTSVLFRCKKLISG